jgi:hypothetical protein
MTRSEHNKKILAVDPSGTGTTGIFFKNGDYEKFQEFTNSDWKKHWDYLLESFRDYQPETVLYETTNYVNSKGKDMTSLFKLLGGIEILVQDCPEVGLVLAAQVKELKRKLLKGEQSITGLEYQPGKGWHHNGKKISVHGLDAYLVYWLWNDKQKISSGKILKTSKMKPNIKRKHYE